MIWTLFGSFGNFPDCLETFQIIQTQFQIIQTLSRLSRHISELSGYLQVQKLSRSPQHISRSSVLFLDYLDTFSRLSQHCLDRTETLQIIHTLFRLSRHIFQINWTLLGLSGIFQDTLLDHPDFFQIIQIHFLDYPDTFQIVRKLSSSSGHFAYYLDILYCKVSGNSSGNNELVAKTF